MIKLEFFSADIVDYILTSITDFKTLLSTISSAKVFYEVFKAHPRSILCAVAYNEVGGALPQALRLAQCEVVPRYYRCVDVSRLPEENKTVNIKFPSEPSQSAELRKLSANAKIAHELEALFSWRCKDRTSRITKLSSNESYKFHRALYRFWLYMNVYGIRQNEDDGNDSDADEDSEQEQDAEEIEARKKSFFEALTTPELNELERIYSFLWDVAKWVARTRWKERSSTEINSKMIFFSGPRTIYECYKDISPQPARDNTWVWVTMPDDHYEIFTSRVDNIRKDRIQGSQQNHSCSSKKAILESIIGEEDRCKQCNAQKGLDLWNETNWGHLLGIISEDIDKILPGRLSRNPVETHPLHDTIDDLSCSTLIKELFSIKEDPFDDLSEQDWLCVDCIENFIKHYLCMWWLDYKRAAGIQIPPDCWYGYNCRTMTHSLHHATRLNHLCVPTRGDP